MFKRLISQEIAILMCVEKVLYLFYSILSNFRYKEEVITVGGMTKTMAFFFFFEAPKTPLFKICTYGLWIIFDETCWLAFCLSEVPFEIAENEGLLQREYLIKVTILYYFLYLSTLRPFRVVIFTADNLSAVKLRDSIDKSILQLNRDQELNLRLIPRLSLTHRLS